MDKWRLFAPAEDWKRPIDIDETQLPFLTDLGERMGLRVGRDDLRKKLFWRMPVVQADSSGGGEGVEFPSGLWIPKAVLSEAEAARYGITGDHVAVPLLAARRTDRLSEHFTAAEFLCQDRSYSFVRVSPELVRQLERVRSELGGAAISISSGYRPPAYNRSVGGASSSTHIDGLAADISAAGIPTDELWRVCEEVIGDDGGVGYYPDQHFCHIDVRGYRSRW